jgi:hypothetical protein
VRVRSGVSWAAGSLLLASGLRRLAHRSGVSDEEAYALLPGDEVITHPMREWEPRAHHRRIGRGDLALAGADGLWPGRLVHPQGVRPLHAPLGVAAGANLPVPAQPLADSCPSTSSSPSGTSSPTAPIRGLPLGHGAGAGPAPGLLLPAASLARQARRTTDEAALAARQEELRAGRLYLEFSWPFVLRPLDADRTRLLLRARNNVSPNGWPGCWMSRSAWWTSRSVVLGRRRRPAETARGRAGGLRALQLDPGPGRMVPVTRVGRSALRAAAPAGRGRSRLADRRPKVGYGARLAWPGCCRR